MDVNIRDADLVTQRDRLQENKVVSVIVRFHDVAKKERLGLALSSLALQSYPWVEPVIVLQDFPEDDYREVLELSALICWPQSFCRPLIINVPGLGPGDHRARLLNCGMAAASGRFLAFLDYDDLLYPNCYTTLVRRVHKTQKAVAFGGAVQAEVEEQSNDFYVFRKKKIFQDKHKLDFFIANQHPIHTFLLDKCHVDDDLLKFDETVNKNEDYIFLLRILARHDWDISAQAVSVAEYSLRIDGSNTIIGIGDADADKVAEWRESDRNVEAIKQQLQLSINGTELKGFLNHYMDSVSRSAVEHERGNTLSAVTYKISQALFVQRRRYSFIRRSRVNLDKFDHGQRFLRIHGWCARTNWLPWQRIGYEPLLIGLLLSNSGEAIFVGEPNVIRLDVREFLGVTGGTYGFDIETEIPAGIDIAAVSLQIYFSDGAIKEIPLKSLSA